MIAPVVMVAAALLAANPAPAPIKIAVLEIKPLDPSDKPTVEMLQEVILADLAKSGRVDAIGSNDIAAMLGLERQRQLLGCSDSGSSCLAELGGALGTDYVLLGTLARLDAKRRLDLKLIDTRSNRVLGREFATAGSSSELVDNVPAVVDRLLKAIPGLSAIPAGAKAEPPPKPLEIPWPAVTVATGAALALGGGGWAGWTAYDFNRRRSDLQVSDVAGLELQKDVGLGLLAAGVVVAGVGTWMWLGAPARPALAQVAAAPISGGGAVFVWSAF